jgi:hypothetical protein
LPIADPEAIDACPKFASIHASTYPPETRGASCAPASAGVVTRPNWNTVVALLELDDLTHRFGGLLAVDHVAMRVEESEVRAIIGPNSRRCST